MELKLTNIKKAYESKEVLKDCTFTFQKGKIYGLLGRNGAGKTTLFNCLTDEIQADAGSAMICKDNGDQERLAPEQVGYVFSTPVLPDFLTGYEFIKFYMDINEERLAPEKTIDDYFDMVKINAEDRQRLIKGYSHGMKNKVQMLCFIIARPPVILLDEPLTSFDVVVALEIKQLLREIKHEHIIIFSTHILQLASDLCDEIVVLNEGRLGQVNQEMLHSKDFEEKIIQLLKDEDENE
ncbi:MAG: ABC transporter ATP-binding protein [Eubacteriales bacterium]|nr:ABC transporter ATP-binding protein [Eubacteriales bacterium]